MTAGPAADEVLDAREIRRNKVRQAIGVLVFFAAIIGLVAMLSYARGGPSGYREPSAEELAGLIEPEQIPGGSRLDVPSALDDRFDRSFPTPLVSPGALRSGGPPPDGIPAINRPWFERPAEVDWLEPQQPVIVVSLERDDGSTDARAYPVQVLIHHEIVNDTIAGRPVAVTYCPLCNSAIAYERLGPDGAVLEFATSGLLLHSSLVMFDRQTESLWSHFTGDAIIGHLAGVSLTAIPAPTVSFGEFSETHPDGIVMSRTTGYGRDYGETPYPGYDDIDADPLFLDQPIDDRLLAKDRVISVTVADRSIAVPRASVERDSVVHVDLGIRQLVLFHAPGTASALDDTTIADGADIGSVGVFGATVVDDRLADGETQLTFAPGGAGTFTSDDGTTWNLLGDAVAGPLEGASLTPIEHFDTFWFAIAAFDPEVTVVGR